MPERFEIGGVEGDEVSLGIAGEDEASGGREDSGPRRGCVLEFPFDLPGRRIDCF